MVKRPKFYPDTGTSIQKGGGEMMETIKCPRCGSEDVQPPLTVYPRFVCVDCGCDFTLGEDKQDE